MSPAEWETADSLWNDSGEATWDILESWRPVCVFVSLCISQWSVPPVPPVPFLGMDIRTSYVTGLSVSATKQFEFSQTRFPPHCSPSLERLKWNIGTLGSRERKMVGWLETSVLWERSQSVEPKKKMTDSFCLAGRRGHPEVGEWRGPEWQKSCQNGDIQQGHANRVTMQTLKGQKGIWGDCRLFLKSDIAH